MTCPNCAIVHGEYELYYIGSYLKTDYSGEELFRCPNCTWIFSEDRIQWWISPGEYYNQQRRNRMKLEVNVWQYEEEDNNGLITLSLPNSPYERYEKRKFLGTTTLDIQEPRKKKLVHQYLFKRKNGKFEITTEHYYSLTNAIENLNPEYTVLHGIPETEKEIEV